MEGYGLLARRVELQRSLDAFSAIRLTLPVHRMDVPVIRVAFDGERLGVINAELGLRVRTDYWSLVNRLGHHALPVSTNQASAMRHPSLIQICNRRTS